MWLDMGCGLSVLSVCVVCECISSLVYMSVCVVDECSLLSVCGLWVYIWCVCLRVWSVSVVIVCECVSAVCVYVCCLRVYL